MNDIKHKKGVWWRILLFIGLSSGAIFMFYQLPLSILITLIISPLLNYLAIIAFFPFLKQERATYITVFLLFITFVAGLFLVGTYRDREEIYVQNFIDGKMVTKDVVVEEEGGSFSWSTKTNYVPDTKKGENVMKIIKYALNILAVISVILSSYFFTIADKMNKEAKLKEYQNQFLG